MVSDISLEEGEGGEGIGVGQIDVSAPGLVMDHRSRLMRTMRQQMAQVE